MRLFIAVVFVCAVELSLGTASSDREIFVEVPSSITVVIKSNATFSCSVRAHALVWYVDDQTWQHFVDRNISFTDPVPDLQNGIFQSTLTAIATEMNNETKVECEAYIFGPNGGATRSNSAFLKIQGLLEASGDFMVQHQSNNIVQLSWIPPYTFPEVPITHFHLSWFNLMTETNGTVVLTLSTMNDSETGKFHYDFSTDDTSPCNIYEFQLRAQNGGGLGAATESVQGSFLSGPLMIQRKTVTTIIEFASADEVDVTFQFPTDACLGRIADNFTVYLYNIHGPGCTHSNLKGDTVRFGAELEVTEIGFRDSIQVLPLNLHYSAVIEARNSIGISNSTEITISTFDVQDGKIEEVSPGSLKITCIFAMGSEAVGCCVMLQGSELSTTVITIVRNSTHLLEATSVVAINGGDTYSMDIYDLEKNETFCDFSNPAVVGIAFNTSTSVSTTITTTVIICSVLGFTGFLFSALIITASIISCRKAVVYCLKKRNKESSKSLDPGPLYEEVTMVSAERNPVVTLNVSYAESIQTKRNICYEKRTVSVGVNRV